jgi:hypothetical protein
MKSKVGIWLFLIAGILWLLVGLRDLFAPGFFSFSGRVVTNSQIVVDFALGVMFLALGASMAKFRRESGPIK